MPRTTQLDFSYPEIADKCVAVALAQPLGHTAPDKLLNIGGVPPDPPRQAGIILAALLDQALEHGSLIDIRPNRNIERTFIQTRRNSPTFIRLRRVEDDLLLHRIEKYLRATRTPPTRFGREVLGDSGFVLNYATVEARDR